MGGPDSIGRPVTPVPSSIKEVSPGGNEEITRPHRSPSRDPARRREYYQRNVERLREQNREWHRRNPEKNRLKTRKYAHSVQGQESIRKQRSSEKYLTRISDYKSQALENNRKWYYSNLARARLIKQASEANRKARKKAAAGQTTRSQVEGRVAYWGWCCWICKGPWEAIDHVKPLAKGGPNWSSNLRPICRSCNSSKRDKWPFLR